MLFVAATGHGFENTPCGDPFLLAVILQVVALSTNVPFHRLNAWASQVRGPLNGFTHSGYQVKSPTRKHSSGPSLAASIFFGFELPGASKRGIVRTFPRKMMPVVPRSREWRNAITDGSAPYRHMMHVLGDERVVVDVLGSFAHHRTDAATTVRSP